MYSGVRDAILQRLTTQTMEEIGLRMHAYMKTRRQPGKEAVQAIGKLDIPETFAEMEVPVFPHRLAGTSWCNWPAVTVRCTNISPRDRTTFVEKDTIWRGIPNSKKKVTFPDGTTITDFGLKSRRPHPEHLDFEFHIRVWAKNDLQMAILTQRIIELLGTDGFLEVRLKDGSTTTVDTEIDTPTPPIEIPPGVIEEISGEYSQIIPFVVEGYSDNSDLWEIIRVIRSRGIEAGGFDGSLDPGDLDDRLFALTNPDVVEDPD